jgi:hypothetical protein
MSLFEDLLLPLRQTEETKKEMGLAPQRHWAPGMEDRQTRRLTGILTLGTVPFCLTSIPCPTLPGTWMNPYCQRPQSCRNMGGTRMGSVMTNSPEALPSAAINCDTSANGPVLPTLGQHVAMCRSFLKSPNGVTMHTVLWLAVVTQVFKDDKQANTCFQWPDDRP